MPSHLWPWSSTGFIEHTGGPRQGAFRCLVAYFLSFRSNTARNASRLVVLSYFCLSLAGTKCPAALIAPNVAVTAASCFCDYGGSNEFVVAKFCSGAFDGSAYFESKVSNAFPSAPYCEGTDTCTTSGSLRKCANNLAVVSLLNINTPANLATLAPGVVSPYYNIEDCPYSFTDGFISGSLVGQITALGYASNLNNGERMMRSDSLGQMQAPNQIYMGSSMRENSQGSPMLVNFGLVMDNDLPLGTDSQPNTMVGVVSWYSAQESSGANSFLVGGSCFGKNAEYTEYSNIITLVNTFCCTLSQAQRAAQCDGVQQCFDDPVPPPPPPPPAVTASDWRMSEGNESCDSACGRAGLTCNVSGQRAVTLAAEAKIVATYYLGIENVDQYPLFSGRYADGPALWAGNLQYDGTVSTCDEPYDQSERFCCCGNDCPKVEPGTPPPPPPSPAPPPPPAPPGSPGQPTNLVQSGNTANAIVLTWTDGSAGTPVESYKVECKVYGGSFASVSLASVTGISRGAQTATVSVPPGTLYTCYVAAYDPSGTPAYGETVSNGATCSYQNSGTCTSRDLLEPTPFRGAPRCDVAPPTDEQKEESIRKQIEVFGKPVSELTGDEFSAAATFSATVPICWYICQGTLTVTDTMLANQIAVLNSDYATAGITFVQQSKTVCSGAARTNWENNMSTDIDSSFDYLESLSQSLGHTNCITSFTGDWAGTNLLGIAQLGLTTYPTQFNGPGTFPGGTAAPYNAGRTMTHEAGHNLGLYHVFSSGCSGQGDQIADTPLGNTNYGCPVGTDSCPDGPGKDAINNFMDYTDDCCMNWFTIQQGLIMQAEIQSTKPQWVTSS